MVPARELRFCFVIDDYESAVHLYRDVFGLEVLLDLDEQGGRGVILNVPEATVELVDREHGRWSTTSRSDAALPTEFGSR